MPIAAPPGCITFRGGCAAPAVRLIVETAPGGLLSMADTGIAARVPAPAVADAGIFSLPTPRAPVLGTIATAIVHMLSLMVVVGVVPTPKPRQVPA
jgi:hypothetical protein